MTTKMWNRRAVVLVGNVIKNDGEQDVQWVKYCQPREKDMREQFPVFAKEVYEPSEPDPKRQDEYRTIATQRAHPSRRRDVVNVLTSIVS